MDWRRTFRAAVPAALFAAAGVAAPAAGDIILPAYVAAASNPNTFSTATPDQLVNNSGLSTPVNTGATLAQAQAATHVFDGNFAQSFVTNAPGTDYFVNGGTPPVIVLDLGADVQLANAVVWNYQNTGGGNANGGNMTRTMDVRLNTAAQGSATFAGTATTLTLLPVADNDGVGGNDLGGVNSAQTVGLTGTGRFVQITLTDNYRNFQGITGGGDRVGLGEFRINAVPEPAAGGLLAAAGVGVLVRRRRTGAGR